MITVAAEAATTYAKVYVDQWRTAIIDSRQQLSQALQQKMQQTIVEASSGGGTVRVKMNGQKQILQTFIDPAAVQGDETTRLAEFRRVPDQIRERLLEFISGGLSATPAS